MRFALILAATLAAASAPAHAQSVSNGQQLYHSICASCHGFPPLGGPNTIQGNPNVLRLALASVPAMRPFGAILDDQDILDITAYLASLTNTTPPGPIVPTENYTDMWWGGESESGWGFNVIQHASNTIFGIMYTYDAQGKRTWFIIPGGAWLTPTRFSGPFGRSNGSPYNVPYRTGSVTQLGEATIEFTSSTTATIIFSVEGTLVTKQMFRLLF